MASDLIPVTFNKIMQSRAYTVFILETPKKRFAIFTEPLVGQNIQMHLTEEKKPRPFTHDLINSIFKGFEITPLQVVINRVEDTTYFARLYLEQKQDDDKMTILEIDGRPSDLITIALMHNLPIFCLEEMLKDAVAVEGD